VIYSGEARLAPTAPHRSPFPEDMSSGLSMALPADIQQLIDTALVSVQSNPKGELAQAYRRQIYDALWDQYADVCQWWAIIAARRVQIIYENKWAELAITSDEENSIPDADGLRLIIRSVANGHLGVLENLYYVKPQTEQAYAQRMIDIAEDVMMGVLVSKYAGQVASGYYYEVMSWDIANEPSDAYFAWWAAYLALGASAGNKPLEHSVGEPVGAPGNNLEIRWSTEWDDLKLVQHGKYAADFAVYAAYAFAYQSDTQDYSVQKLREFWQWWLTEAIEQAWDKENKK
jgi:hypothetical protein